MKVIHRTVKGGVMTTKGFVPNLEHPSGKFLMPVKVKPMATATGNPRPPTVSGGFLVFALPDGGSFVSGIKVKWRINEA